MDEKTNFDSSLAEYDLVHSAPGIIRSYQEQLLAKHVEYAVNHSKFYRQMFARLNLTSAAITSYDDLLKIPTTTKADLENNEDSFLAVAEADVADICLTSGTTGTPVAFYQSGVDLERLARNEEFAFRLAGITCNDRVLIAAAIDRCFMAGMAYFLGLKKIGATVIRGGSSSLGVVAQLVQRFRPSTMVGVPTYFLALADTLSALGITAADCGVQRLICIGEPVRQQDFTLSALGQRLQHSWGAQVYGTYASTEMATTFCDCHLGRGGHLNPALMLVETLDEQGQRVADGTPGEVVATPLQVTAMPLLRFRTGDIACLYRQPCECGLNTVRLGAVLGRKDQMLKYRGTTVYPPAIFAVLQGLDYVMAYYVEVYDDFALSDRIKVVVAINDQTVDAQQIAEQIAARIRIKPEVVIAGLETVRRKISQEDKRKPVLFFDYRTQVVSCY
jgi:phenylacetate-CoA ligase